MKEGGLGSEPTVGDHESFVPCWALGRVCCASAGVIRRPQCLSLWRRPWSFLFRSALPQETGEGAAEAAGAPGRAGGRCVCTGQPGIGINHLQELSGQTGGSYRGKVKQQPKQLLNLARSPKQDLIKLIPCPPPLQSPFPGGFLLAHVTVWASTEIP